MLIKLLSIILKLIIAILILLIFLLIFQKNELLLHIFEEWKIYYKNEKKLKLNVLRKEIKNLKNIKIKIKDFREYTKLNKPKISLIITIYNQENFLKYAYLYIQKQKLEDIEIIFIDDASTDMSSKIIQSLMKNDKRIIYIKNKINKGAFYSRNEGILLSKGKYILIHDPDDLLLMKAYKTIISLIFYNFMSLEVPMIKTKYGKGININQGFYIHSKSKMFFF